MEPPVKQGSVDEGALSTIMTEAMVDSHSAEAATQEKVPHSSLHVKLIDLPKRHK